MTAILAVTGTLWSGLTAHTAAAAGSADQPWPYKFRSVPGPVLWHQRDDRDLLFDSWIDSRYLLVVVGHWGGESVHAYRLDTATGRRQKISRLGSGLLGEPVRHHYIYYPVAISPDGHWLLAEYDGLEGGSDGWTAAFRIGSAKTLRWHVTSPEYWLDNQRFCAWDSDNRTLTIESLTHSPAIAVKPTGLSNPDPDSANGYTSGSWVIGQTSSGMIVLAVGDLHAVGAQLLIYKFSPKPGAKAILIGGGTVPVDEVMDYLDLSPDCRTLAYVLSSDSISGGGSSTIWLSDPDGSHARKFSEFPSDYAGDLEFAHNGKELTLIDDGQILTARVRR